jgi:HD-like signal output (HDOD) protein
MSTPCDPSPLRRPRGRDLIDLLSPSERARSVDLAPLPLPALQAVELSARDGALPKDLVAVLRGEPVITARMLQLVNSSLFGLRRRVLSLDEAAEYLGVDRMAEIALTAAMAARRSARGFMDSSTADFLWKRATAVALCSAELSGEPHPIPGGPAYLGGLLEGLGLLWIHQRLPPRFVERIAQLNVNGRESFQSQRLVLGTHYLLKGAELLNTWGLPEELAARLMDLHEPGAHHEDLQLTCCILGGRHLARLLLEVLDAIPPHLQWTLPAGDPQLFAQQGLDPESTPELLAQLDHLLNLGSARGGAA